MIRRGSIRQNISLFDAISQTDNRTLIDAGTLIRTLVLNERVDIDAGTAPLSIFVHSHHQPRGIDIDHFASRSGDDHRAGIPCGNGLHASSDNRRLGPQKRHRLALHI